MVKGKVMYGAVYFFGPRWAENAGIASMVSATESVESPLRTDEDFLRLAEFIERNPEMSLEAIESLTPERLRREVPEPRRRPQPRIGDSPG